MALKRPLTLHDGLQKQQRDSDHLDVGAGLVARQWNDATGAFDERELEVLSNSLFRGDIKIEGELQVVGASQYVENLVSVTTFNEKVVFGEGLNQATDEVQFLGIANFDGSIDGDVSDYNMVSAAAAKLQAGTNLDLDGATVNLDSAGTMDILAVGAATFGAASLVETIGTSKQLIADSLAETLAGAHTMNAATSVETLGGKTITTQSVFIVLAAASTGLDFDGGVINADASGAMHLGAGADSEWLVTGQLDLTPTVKLVASSADIQLIGAMDFDGAIDHDGASFDSLVTGQFKAEAGTKVQMVAPSLDFDGAIDHDGASFDSLVSGTWTASAAGNMNLDSSGASVIVKSASADGQHVIIGSGQAGLAGGYAASPDASSKDVIISGYVDLLMEAGRDGKLRVANDLLLRSENTMNMQAVGAVIMDFESTFQIDAEGAFDFDAKAMDIDAVGDINIDASVDTVAKDGGDIRIAANWNSTEQLGGNLNLVAGKTFSASSANGANMNLVAAGQLYAEASSEVLFSSLNSHVQFAADTDGNDTAKLQLNSGGASLLYADAGQDLKLGANGQDDLKLLNAGNFELRLDAQGNPVHQIKQVKDPTDDQDAVTKKYMEENGGGTAKLPLSASNVPVAGDLVSLDSSGAVQTAHPTSRQYAIGLVVKVEGTEALVRMLGKFEKANAFTAGLPIYMDADGALSQSTPTAEGDMVQRVGYALSATHILVAIGEPVIL